jgi:hypothetical protein
VSAPARPLRGLAGIDGPENALDAVPPAIIGLVSERFANRDLRRIFSKSHF